MTPPTDQSGDAGDGYELVRVAREVLDELLTKESPPVVLVSADRLEDGTCELMFRSVEL